LNFAINPPLAAGKRPGSGVQYAASNRHRAIFAKSEPRLPLRESIGIPGDFRTSAISDGA